MSTASELTYPSQLSSRWSTDSGHAGTIFAVSMVSDGRPMAFWCVLNSPGDLSDPRTPSIRILCRSRTRSSVMFPPTGSLSNPVSRALR